MNKGIHKNIKIVVVIASLVMVCGLIFAGILLKKNPKADNVNGNEQTRFEAIERDTKISVDAVVIYKLLEINQKIQAIIKREHGHF